MMASPFYNMLMTFYGSWLGTSCEFRTYFQYVREYEDHLNKIVLYCFGKTKRHKLVICSCLAAVWAPSLLSTLPQTPYWDWKNIEDHFEKSLSSVKKNYGRRLALINSVLSSLAIFMMPLLEIPKGVWKRLDFYRSLLFGNSPMGYFAYSKGQGCLSIQDLKVQNKCLLSKWLFKLLSRDRIWQLLLQNKYLWQKQLSW